MKTDLIRPRKASFQIGDRVRFLDAQGEGFISRIFNETTVGVTTEDNFEIPSSVANLLKIGQPTSVAEQLFYQQSSFGSTEKITLPEKGITQIEEEYQGAIMRDDEPKGLYFCWRPCSTNKGNIVFYLINHSPYPLTYQILLQGAETYFGTDSNTIEAETQKQIKVISAQELGFWSQGCLQGFWIQSPNFSILPSICQDFKIKNKYMEQADGSWFPILTLSALETQAQIHPYAIKPSEQNTPQNTPQEKSFTSSAKIPVIDLHIEQITPSFATLSSEACLEKQLQVFESHLNQAIITGLPQIIFIHGIGKGILKREMEKRLQTYKGLHFCTASSAHYGFGAMEIFLNPILNR